MADEDKEKAEKLAAAKKRFEQLKKEQKKGKKGGKKKGDKSADAAADDNTETPAADDAADAAETNDEAAGAEAEAAADTEAPADAEDENADTTTAAATPERPEATRQPSLSQQSKQRSESFRQGAADGPQAEVQELYRKQAARIEALEKENKTLQEAREQSAARLGKAEEELDSLREGSSDVAELKTKAKEADRLSSELAAVQRQLSHAQQQQAAAADASASAGSNTTTTTTTTSNNNTPTTSGHARRASAAPTPALDAQLASKDSTIESLELQISNLRHEIATQQSAAAARESEAEDLEARAKAAESATASVQQELDALKVTLAFPAGDDDEAGGGAAAAASPEALKQRITVLESDVRGAQSALEAAGARAAQLEQKIAALTTLHRDALAASQHKDKELADLRATQRRHQQQQQRRGAAASHVQDVSEFELADEETETGRLQARIRALEAETFDLRRGVWRERRAELQPGMEDDGSGGGGNYYGNGNDYEDVDLNGPYSPRVRDNRGGVASAAARQTSSFSDVITSGINAFTNRPREQSRPHTQHDRKQSLGLMSDDGFDEDAFRLAQEEEAKRRIERVKEVKRGLEQWRGWRVDIADQRQQGLGPGRDCGPVFEV